MTPILRYENPGREQKEIVIPDPVAERALVKKLRDELQLTLGQTTKFSGDDAADFILRSQRWEKSDPVRATAKPDGRRATSAPLEIKTLIPHFINPGAGFSLVFNTQNQPANAGLDLPQSDDSSGSFNSHSQATAAAVFQAWRENRNYVSLLDGGWAKLPLDWLTQYGERVVALLEAKDRNQSLPPFHLPELAQLCAENHQALPQLFRKLTERTESRRTRRRGNASAGSPCRFTLLPTARA